MPDDMFRIVYCSRNAMAAAADPAAIDQILGVSRRNNAAAGVTGALLYNDGIFAQTLEGPFDAVQAIFERIQEDPRHESVVVLQAEGVADRLFGAWSMAHVEPENPDQVRETLSGAIVADGETATPALLDLLTRIIQYVPA